MEKTLEMKFYQYRSVKRSEEWLTHLENNFKQKIYVSPLNSFNDPFEGRFIFKAVDSDIALRDKELRVHALSSFRQNGHPDLTDDELELILRDPEFIELNSKTDIVADGFFESHGAICLTRRNDNLLMWSYYADSHKGYCLEVELDFDALCKLANLLEEKMVLYLHSILTGEEIISFRAPDNSIHFCFLKVKYTNEVPTIEQSQLLKLRTSAYEHVEYIVKHSVGIKSLEWGHEEEFRLIATLNSQPRAPDVSPDLLKIGYGSLVPFLKVTGVIIGEGMKQAEKEEIRKLAGQYKMNIMYASRHGREYKIVVLNDNAAIERKNQQLEIFGAL